MGLIMLILIGTVPTAYAVESRSHASATAGFLAVSQQTVQALDHYVDTERRGRRSAR